jgi:hypothetical protein
MLVVEIQRKIPESCGLWDAGRSAALNPQADLKRAARVLAAGWLLAQDLLDPAIDSSRGREGMMPGNQIYSL